MATKQEIDAIISRLAAAPERLAHALSRLEDADSVLTTRPDEWSPAEVLAHVRAAHDILAPRIFAVLVRDNPLLLSLDEVLWARVARYAQLPVIESLEVVRLRRKELVHALRGLSPEDWDRTGTHEVLGRLSVMEIARYLADHDEEHCAQIEQTSGN